MHCGSVNVYVCLHIEVQNLENLFLRKCCQAQMEGAVSEEQNKGLW